MATHNDRRVDKVHDEERLRRGQGLSAPCLVAFKLTEFPDHNREKKVNNGDRDHRECATSDLGQQDRPV